MNKTIKKLYKVINSYKKLYTNYKNLRKTYENLSKTYENLRKTWTWPDWTGPPSTAPVRTWPLRCPAALRLKRMWPAPPRQVQALMPLAIIGEHKNRGRGVSYIRGPSPKHPWHRVLPKIFGNQQTPKKSILRRWYTQIPTSHAHGPWDDLGGEIRKYHQ